MAKWVSDDVLDGALDIIATGTILTLCSAQPTTRTEAVTTYMLADVVIDAGDFTIANGDVSGRKITVAAQSDITVDNTGTGTHVAICDGSNLLLVTTCTDKSVTALDTIDFPAFDYEIPDPV